MKSIMDYKNFCGNLDKVICSEIFQNGRCVIICRLRLHQGIQTNIMGSFTQMLLKASEGAATSTICI